jgi:hypothetical protein
VSISRPLARLTVLATRCAATLGLLAVLGGACNQGHACPAFCNSGGSATFELSCVPTDLSAVAVSGPCAAGDAGASIYVSPSSGSYASLAETQYVYVSSPNAGVCHVVLTFANGFIYGADVTFAALTDDSLPGCPPCPSYVGPTQGTFLVPNPKGTCVDGGLDS